MGTPRGPRGGLSLALITHAHIVRTPLFYVLLLIGAGILYVTPWLTLFAFGEEEESVREMGAATLSLWSLVLCLTIAGSIVTDELEDRTALSVFSKPVSRTGYLVAKFAGLSLALAAGLLFLGLLFLFTLWWNFVRPELRGERFWENVRSAEQELGRKVAPDEVYWRVVRHRFVREDLRTVATAGALALGQSVLLAALAVTLSALLPSGATAGSLVFAYLLVNMADYLAGALSGAGPPLAALGEALRTVLPNFGYLSLQSHVSEGKPVGPEYICLAGTYVILYSALILGIGSALFARREIR